MSSGRLACLSLPLFVSVALATAGCAAPPLVVGASYAADGGLLYTSNKTSTDHLISMVSKQDCAVWRVFKSRPICSERDDGHDPYAVDYVQPQRMVAEDGVRYLAPLRSAPDVPATSWDPAAYASAPPSGPVATPAAVQPAVADATPTPAPKPAALPAAVAEATPTPKPTALPSAPPLKPAAFPSATADTAPAASPAAKPAARTAKKAKPARRASRGRAASGS
jgi:hypothetical protein